MHEKKPKLIKTGQPYSEIYTGRFGTILLVPRKITQRPIKSQIENLTSDI